jgi:hypothetical protein
MLAQIGHSVWLKTTILYLLLCFQVKNNQVKSGDWHKYNLARDVLLSNARIHLLLLYIYRANFIYKCACRRRP